MATEKLVANTFLLTDRILNVNAKVKKKKKASGADENSNILPSLFNLAQGKKSRIGGSGQRQNFSPVLENKSTNRNRKRMVTNHHHGRYRKRKRETKSSQK
jgi:hypothetical protein